MEFSKQFLMLVVVIKAGPLLTLPLMFHYALDNLLAFTFINTFFALFHLTPIH
jgi:hypothetical protein